MANLGSDNTPVVGQEFSLPAGAQIDEDGGDLVIRDSGGSIVLRRDEGAGTWDFVSGDLVNVASLEVAEQSITNETLISATLSANQSIASGSAVQVGLDIEIIDDRAEFDPTTGDVVVDKTGWYIIEAKVRHLDCQDQDRLVDSFHDFDGGNSLITVQKNASRSATQDVQISGIVNLTSGTTYGLRAQNADSSDRIGSGQANTYLNIRSVFK